MRTVQAQIEDADQELYCLQILYERGQAEEFWVVRDIAKYLQDWFIQSKAVPRITFSAWKRQSDILASPESVRRSCGAVLLNRETVCSIKLFIAEGL